MKPKRELTIALLVMLLMSTVIVPQNARSQKIRLANIPLDVERPNEPPEKRWGNSLVINTPQTVHFRWKKTDPGVARVEWQVREENYGFSTQAPEPLRKGDSVVMPFYPPPYVDGYWHFNVTFQSFLPATPPTRPKHYWVRVSAYNSAGVFTGTISQSMRITYVKASTEISAVTETPHGTYAELSFSTSTPTIPIVEASTKPTIRGPAFAAGDVQSSAFPLLAGYQTNHKVRLDNLKPGIRYYYLIKVKDQKGSVDFKHNYFTTQRRRLTVVFQEIYMKDDSDDLSEGDLSFGFYLNDQILFARNVGLDTGQRLPLPASNFTASRLGPAEPFVIRVLGVDDDEMEGIGGAPFHLNTVLERFELLKSNFPGDAADGASSFTFRTGPDEAYSESFIIKTTPRKLKFEVKGTYTVSYQ